MAASASSGQEAAAEINGILSAETLKDVRATDAELAALLRFIGGASAEEQLRPKYGERAPLIVAQAQAEISSLIALRAHPLPVPLDMKTLTPSQWALLIQRVALFDVGKDLGWGRSELNEFLRLTARPAVASGLLRELGSAAGGEEFARLQLQAVRTKAMTAVDLGALKPVADSAIVKITPQNYAAEIENSTLPLVIDYAAVWCDNCRVVDGLLEDLAREYKGRVKFAKVDVDEMPGIADKFRVKGLPTVVFLRKGGSEIDRRIGLDPFGLQNLKAAYESDIRGLLTGS